MGTILSFANRFRDSGQWTASERGRLEALTEQFFGGGENVRVVFGATDDGAPWCAVMNEDEEVLVHVARVADQFLVHFVMEDIMAQGANLREALGQWLSPEPERQGVVVPFGRFQNGPELLMLLAVAVFLEDQLRLAGPHLAEGGGSADLPVAEPPLSSDTMADTEPEAKSSAAAGGHDEPDAPAASTIAATTPGEGEAADQVAPRPQSAASSESSEAAPSEAPADSPLAIPTVLAMQIRGGDGDDLLVGGPGAEHIVGGPGNDTLVGGGGHDTLDGGAGDDRIVLTPDAVAIGGAGADTFVISAPTILGKADTLLGTIVDFSTSEGDKLVAAQGDLVILAHSEAPLTTTGASAKTDPDLRVQVDFNGDGHADGYVLFTATSSHAAPAPSHAPVAEEPVEHTEPSTNWYDIFA